MDKCRVSHRYSLSHSKIKKICYTRNVFVKIVKLNYFVFIHNYTIFLDGENRSGVEERNKIKIGRLVATRKYENIKENKCRKQI